MIHQHTMTQLKTAQDPVKLLSATNITANTTASTETITTTQPASAGGAVVFSAGNLNYLKIIPLLSTAANSPTLRVTGWTKSDTGGYWVPQQLFYGTVSSVASSGTSINSTTLYTATGFTKTDGDAKVYNVTGTNSGGMLLVDTLGCQLIKIEFGNTTTASTVNAFIGAL
jgi:hypothetical protein